MAFRALKGWREVISRKNWVWTEFGPEAYREHREIENSLVSGRDGREMNDAYVPILLSGLSQVI